MYCGLCGLVLEVLACVEGYLMCGLIHWVHVRELVTVERWL